MNDNQTTRKGLVIHGISIGVTAFLSVVGCIIMGVVPKHPAGRCATPVMWNDYNSSLVVFLHFLRRC